MASARLGSQGVVTGSPASRGCRGGLVSVPVVPPGCQWDCPRRTRRRTALAIRTQARRVRRGERRRRPTPRGGSPRPRWPRTAGRPAHGPQTGRASLPGARHRGRARRRRIRQLAVRSGCRVTAVAAAPPPPGQAAPVPRQGMGPGGARHRSRRASPATRPVQAGPLRRRPAARTRPPRRMPHPAGHGCGPAADRSAAPRPRPGRPVRPRSRARPGPPRAATLTAATGTRRPVGLPFDRAPLLHGRAGQGHGASQRAPGLQPVPRPQDQPRGVLAAKQAVQPDAVVRGACHRAPLFPARGLPPPVPPGRALHRHTGTRSARRRSRPSHCHGVTRTASTPSWRVSWQMPSPGTCG
jgi:hypothetical protein